MMRKIVLLGYFQEYDKIANSILWESQKGNIEVNGIYMPNMKSITSIDGFKVLNDEALLLSEFDYMIVYSEQILEFAIRICEMRNISRRSVLPGRIFSIANFDFEKYIQLYESNISIMANRCFGGFLYNRLGMEFCSPFINVHVEIEEFLKLMLNLKEYMGKDLAYVSTDYVENSGVTHMKLEDVNLHFHFCKSKEEAENHWYQRRDRINYDNIFIACELHLKEQAERFIKLPVEKKIGFADFEIEHPQIIDNKIFKNEYYQRYSCFADIFNNQGQGMGETCLFDVFNLLNGEADFMRIKI